MAPTSISTNPNEEAPPHVQRKFNILFTVGVIILPVTGVVMLTLTGYPDALRLAVLMIVGSLWLIATCILSIIYVPVERPSSITLLILSIMILGAMIFGLWYEYGSGSALGWFDI
jgi:hypothetical protein